MGITDIDSNQIETVLAFKETLASQASNADLSYRLSQETRKVNEFGEILATKTKQVQKHLTDVEVGQVVAAYEKGKSTYALASEFGCHRKTISGALKSRGVVVTKKVKLDEDGVIAMYEQRHTAQEIADRYGVGRQIVIRCLKANGVRIRRRWEY